MKSADDPKALGDKLQQSQLSAEDAKQFTSVTGNSTPGTTPLGSINRVRWAGEVASRKARMRA